MKKDMKASDGKVYSIPFVIMGLENGEEYPNTPPEVIAEAKRQMAINNKADFTLYGKVVRQTAKAVLVDFAVNIDGYIQPLNGEHWMPLSQVQIGDRGFGGQAAIDIPQWLIEKKK